MAEKATTMKLKVDLQCEKCYKKVKKVLCKFPQVQDQLYDEKTNTVTIKVVCCSPEKLRDKLCYKGGGSIKSIEIVEQPQLKPPPKPKAAEPEKKEEEPSEPPPRSLPSGPPREPPPPPPPVTGTSQIGPATKFPEPALVSVFAYPPPVHPDGLFYYGGTGGPPPFYGRPIYGSYGGGEPSYVRRYDQNLWEEEESGCTLT